MISTKIFFKEGRAMNLFELTPEQWMELGISAGILLGVIIIGRWLIRLIVGKGIRRLAGMTETEFDDIILKATLGPLHWLVILAALDFGLRRLDFLPTHWQEALDTFFYVAYFILGTIFLLRMTTGLFNWYAGKLEHERDTSTVAQMLPFIRRIATIVIGVIALVTLLGQFTDVSALLATLGVGSLAIALAAQTSLEDLFSGFLIMFDRPYLIGDRVEIQELNTWGDVIDIGLRSTRIRTRDNRYVIVPNSIMGRNLVVNYSRPDTEYRIEIELALDLDTDIDLARKTMIEAVKDVEGVLPNRRVEALFLAFDPAGLRFRVRWWLDSYYDARRMFDKVNSAIYTALNEVGIKLGNQGIDNFHFIEANELNKINKVFRDQN
jgi:small-conductance mechanosensitive channel